MASKCSSDGAKVTSDSEIDIAESQTFAKGALRCSIMPSESFKELLDRDLAKAEAANLIEATCPLLREIVNYATSACVRCMRAPDRGKAGEGNESVAPFVLYQQLIEQTDANQELALAMVTKMNRWIPKETLSGWTVLG